jgi:hypothetical protein
LRGCCLERYYIPYTRHKVAENNRQAVKIAVMAGIDEYGS